MIQEVANQKTLYLCQQVKATVISNKEPLYNQQIADFGFQALSKMKSYIDQYAPRSCFPFKNNFIIVSSSLKDIFV